MAVFGHPTVCARYRLGNLHAPVCRVLRRNRLADGANLAPSLPGSAGCTEEGFGARLSSTVVGEQSPD